MLPPKPVAPQGNLLLLHLSASERELMATNLNKAGIELEFSRPDHSGRRIVSIRAATGALKSSSASSAIHHSRNVEWLSLVGLLKIGAHHANQMCGNI